MVEKLGHSEITTAGSDTVKKAYALFFTATHERKQLGECLAHLKRRNAEVSSLSATYS